MEPQDEIEETHKVRIFDTDDKSLKILGELLSNDTSRKIIKALIDKQMYTNEIATKLDMRVNLVIHHLKKMESLGLLEITNKQLVKRGIDRRHFRWAKNLFIRPGDTREEIEESSVLKKIFKDGVKFAAVGFVSLFVFMSNMPRKLGDDITWKFTDLFEYPYQNDPSFLPLLIIIMSLIAGRLYSILKKKKNRSLKI